MEEIAKNTLITILITFNAFVGYQEGKKVYQEHQKYKVEKNQRNLKLKIKKTQIKKMLADLNINELNQPLYGEFTKEEASRFLEITHKLKQGNQILYKFETELLKHVNLENMRNFIKNAPYINIYNHKNPKKASVLGTFDGQSKEIHIYKDNEKTLNHELLHAASADFNYSAVGFSVDLEKIGRFGEGINEGYTELLNNRFFANNSKSYLYLQNLVKIIESLYENKEDMLEDYFNADIFGLIGELSKTIPLEDIIDIIVEMDQFLSLKNASYLDYLKLKHKILKSAVKKEQKSLVKFKKGNR